LCKELDKKKEDEEAALNSEMLYNSNLFLPARYTGEPHISLAFASVKRLLTSKFLAGDREPITGLRKLT
jgi:hypothetical protein